MCPTNVRCWTAAILKKWKIVYISSRLTDFDDLYVMWLTSEQRCIFWGLIDTACHLGRKTFKLSYDQNYSSDSNLISQNDKQLQVLFVGRSLKCVHKRKMADGRYLEKMKNRYISATVWPILTISTSYDLFPHKDDVPLGDNVNTTVHLWGQIP